MVTIRLMFSAWHAYLARKTKWASWIKQTAFTAYGLFSLAFYRFILHAINIEDIIHVRIQCFASSQISLQLFLNAMAYFIWFFCPLINNEEKGRRAWWIEGHLKFIRELIKNRFNYIFFSFFIEMVLFHLNVFFYTEHMLVGFNLFRLWRRALRLISVKISDLCACWRIKRKIVSCLWHASDSDR